MAATPRTEFAQAIRAIASERGLDPDVILGTIKHAIVAAYKRDAKEEGVEVEGKEFEVELDSVSGEAKIFAWPEEEEDKKEDVTPPGFGRIAAQTAKQVIHQKIREAEKGAIMDEYNERVGSIITGMILRFEGPDVRVDLGRAEGIMPASERVPNERLNPNQRLSFLLKDIEETPRGKKIILSRADEKFVQKLFEREVPEMSTGSVEVKAIAREPGVRTKMAVVSNQSGVDPVGSCVGQKGVRVQAVTNELGGERVDIIPWSGDVASFIKASLQPAEGLSVITDDDENVAKIKAPEDQLSMAIGKDGQNARLAAKLTGWKIEVESLEGDKPATTDDTDEDADGADKKETATTEETEDGNTDDTEGSEDTEKESNTEETEKETEDAEDGNTEETEDSESTEDEDANADDIDEEE